MRSVLAKVLVVGVVLAGIVLAAALGSPGFPEGCLAGGWPFGWGRTIAVVDDAGREVRLEGRPQRIVSVAPSNTEVLFAIGLGDRVVGVTNFDKYPPEVAAIEKVGDAWALDYEKIVSLRPDLVLAVGTAESQAVKGLEGYGLKVFVVQAVSVADVAADIELIGRVTGAEAAAERVAEEVRARVAAVAGRVAGVPEAERPTVFWALDDLLWTVGPGSFVDDLITLAGGRNVGRGLGQPYGQFSLEGLLEADPDVIIIPVLDPAVPANLARLPGWENLRAVGEGRVHQIDPDVVSQPVPRIVEGLETVARLLHPDLFGD